MVKRLIVYIIVIILSYSTAFVFFISMFYITKTYFFVILAINVIFISLLIYYSMYLKEYENKYDKLLEKILEYNY